MKDFRTPNCSLFDVRDVDEIECVPSHEGYVAFLEGESEKENPYSPENDTDKYNEWLKGWTEGKLEDERT